MYIVHNFFLRIWQPKFIRNVQEMNKQHLLKISVLVKHDVHSTYPFATGWHSKNMQNDTENEQTGP